MKTVALGEVADVNPKAPRIPGDVEVSFVGMVDLNAVSAETQSVSVRRYAEVSKGYTTFRNGDVLVAKITPCFENNKIGQARLQRDIGVGSTEFHVVRPGKHLDARYVLHMLRQDCIRHQGELRMTGSAGQRRVPADFLKQLKIPLPPLDEQRRIAAILDHADGLRVKRRRAIAQLGDLAESIFLDLFSEDAADAVSFDSVVTNFRNGLSPAKAGTVMADVLTLSAVTQGIFDPTAVKTSTFMAAPPAAMRVSGDDFLICRGNGNLNLVGVGVSPGHDHPDLTFPDTVIAASFDAAVVDPVYLEMAWKRPSVRRQIESVARTTNGTYKINQQSLGAVRIVIPPLSEQQEFARRIGAIPNPDLGEMDELFQSLQSRAFSGQL